MAHAFSPIAAKPAFGNITQSDYASDYIQNKIAKLAYCSDVRNANCKKKFSQSELLLFNKGRLLNSYAFCAGTSLINEANLVAGLYTESDLSGVAVLCDVSGDACITPTAISSLDVPFYEHYLIDPDGQLFGNTPCGMTNFTKYMSVPVISILGSPIDLIAIAEIGSVLLSWTAPMTSDRSPITDYRVYWSTDNPDAPAPADAPIVGLAFAAPPVGWTLIDTKLVDSMYKVTGLDDGTTYYFKVEAVGLLGGGGAGTFSEVVSTTTLDIPSDPSGLVIVETGDGQVLLTWTAPESNGGSIITNYSIQMNNNNRVATSWNSYTHPVSTTTSITLSGLITGEPYWFRVAAINRVGMGPYLLSSASTTLSSFVTPTTTGSVTRSVINNYNSYVYGPGSSSFTSNKNMTINFLVVAAGTSGQANSLGYTSSGGGSGGILQGTLDITANNPIDIVVGGGVGGNVVVNNIQQTGYSYGWQGGASYILDNHTHIHIISESCPTRSNPPNNYVSDSTAIDISHNYPGLPCTSTPCPDEPGNGAPGINGHIMSLYGGYKNIMCSSSGGGGGGGMDTTTYAVPTPYLGGIAGIGAGNGGSSNFESNNAGFGIDASAGSYGSGGGGAGSKSIGNYNYLVGAGADGVVIIYFTYPIVDPASVTPLHIISGPSAPISLIASIVGSNVSLNWTAPIYNGGATIINYFVRYSDSSSNGPWTNISTIYVTTNATIPLSLLISNTPHYFQVVAINSAGLGQWSGSASITTAPGPPTAPTNIQIVSGNEQVQVLWDPPIHIGGTPVTSYSIQYSLDNSSWIPRDVSGIDITTNVSSPIFSTYISGLSPDTEYWFKMAAKNSVYTGSYAISTPPTIKTLMTTPISLQKLLNDSSSILIQWLQPNNIINSTITDYIVQYSSDNKNTWTTFTHITHIVPQYTSVDFGDFGDFWDASINITDLSSNTSYYFRVAAVFANGVISNYGDSTTPYMTAAEVPTLLTIDASDSSITLSWIPPSNHTNIYYGINYSTDEASLNDVIDISSNDTSYNITGLNNGTLYYFRVWSINSGGNSSYFDASATPITTPDRPTNIDLSLNSITGDTQVQISWDLPAYNGGSTISSYSIQYSLNNSTWTQPIIVSLNDITHNTSSSSYSTDISGLMPYTEYWFKMAAVNIASGRGAYSTPSTIKTLMSAPTGLYNNGTTSSVVDLSWAPLTGYDTSIIDYNVQYSTDNTTWSTFLYYGEDYILPYQGMTGLSSNTLYNFRVAAMSNNNVISIYCVSISATTLPDHPNELNPVPSDGSITLSWTPPSNHTNIHYGINHNTDNTDNTSWNSIPDISTNNTSCTITGLNNGTLYYFRVYSMNSALSTTNFSYASTYATPNRIPDPPTYLHGTWGMVPDPNGTGVITQVSIYWTASPSTNIEYYITYLVNGIIDSSRPPIITSATSYTFNVLSDKDTITINAYSQYTDTKILSVSNYYILVPFWTIP